KLNMKRFTVSIGLVALLVMAASPFTSLARMQTQAPVSIAVDLDPASVAGIRIEGLASDSQGRLYTSDLDSRRFFRFTPSTNNLETLGTLPRTASGMAFDAAGNLYMASGDVILRVGSGALGGSQISASDVVTFATGVTGANGLAFDTSGRLYVSGGASGNIYIVASTGVTGTFASGFISERQDQRISTNGLAFWTDGMLYSSNTGTGSIDRIGVNADGTVGQVQQFVKDPLLLGADGITFASNGDLYVAANERNAIVRVTPQGQVSDVAANGNSGPLEFPASPSFSGNALYASNFDIARGANSPNTPGIGASLARVEVGVTGLPLPVAAQSITTPAPSTPVAGTPAPATPVPPTPVASPTTVAPTVAVPEPTVPTEPVASPQPTITTPGMPTTGTGTDNTYLLLVTLVVCSAAIALGGAVLRGASRKNTR
ncbi:MAG: SMP-30/gluconolactonase/LRE family protein, partial [Chloroflexia bacterium]